MTVEDREFWELLHAVEHAGRHPEDHTDTDDEGDESG